MKETENAIKIELTVPTVFPDYNQQHDLPANQAHNHILVQRMKHKHVRKLQMLAEDQQFHFIMGELTGLSSDDLDELDVEDSAKITEVIYGFLKRFAEIGRK